jgi:hypothetical protein
LRSERHDFFGFARSLSIAIGGVPKITNSNYSPAEACSECSTSAGIMATLPGRRGWVSGPKVLSTYNVLRGGLLPFGMVFVVLSPWLAGKARGVV